MIIIYYTKDDKILNCHLNTLNYNEDELKVVEEEFNKYHDEQAHIVYVEDNSITAWLYNRYIEKRNYDNETINDIRRLLSEADDIVSHLEC